jgi:two-component system, chemotaxis family, sensor kinase CheA
MRRLWLGKERARESAMDELVREFLIESQEGLDRMERCLTDLEQRPMDEALVAEIFRSVHTIKGTTGFLGYRRLERLAHSGENVLGLLRDGKVEASASVVTTLLKLLDGLRTILRSIEEEDNEGAGDDGALIGRLEELQSMAMGPQPATAPASGKARQPFTVHKTASGRRSSRAKAKKQTFKEEPKHPAVQQEGETDAGLSHPTVSRGTGGFAAESTLRVDVALLNRIMNLVGELVLTRNQVLKAASAHPGLTLLSRRLDMVTADLRESVMKARMQPVSHAFSKIPRMVRDLAQTLQRRVRLEMEGQETELDKSLLEAIKDPLTHAVRNSIDHGIETPEARLAAGKDAEGTLKLRAMQEGSYVIIEISDDGAGIAVDRVRDRAVERGLITAERAEQSSERELLQLIFVAGFSTASAVTKVSGRGVGMDVVRTNVEKIGGKVELESRPGKGTTLRLRIPLTIAIIPALIIRSAGQSYALPQGALSELVHIAPGKSARMIEWIDSAPVYRLRGRLLPLVFLDGLLSPGTLSETTADRYIAVLDTDGRVFGLVVDELADPEEIVVKPLNKALKSIGLYSGATVLGSGDLALILDPGAVAVRAGIQLFAGGEENSAAHSGGVETASDAVEYLLVEADGHRAAIPLEHVLRIEQLPISRIEYVSARPVVSRGSQILPVEDAGGVLANAGCGASSSVVIVVCREENRDVGIAVSRVVDVAAGSALFEAGTHCKAEGATLLKERITDIVDLRGMGVPSVVSDSVIDQGALVEGIQ